MTSTTETPEFVAWTLVQACELRGSYDLDDPFATERRLKGIRALAAAIAQQRVIDHWCLAPQTINHAPDAIPLGFLEQDVIGRWGNRQTISQLCHACPANIPSPSPENSPPTPSWAGCFGWLALRASNRQLPQRLAGPNHSPLQAQIEWRALWESGRYQGDQARQLAEQLSQALDSQDHGQEPDPGLDDPWRLVTALQQAAEIGNLCVVAKLTPAGVRSGKDWRLPAHCPLCGTPSTTGRPPCNACGTHTTPHPARNRGSRGIRPYRDLREVLTDAQIRSLQQAASRRDLPRPDANQ